MITKLLMLGLLLTIPLSGHSQTAETLINEGRAFLAAHNLTNANARFAEAVRTAPNDETANVLLAATRLLVLPSQPAAQAFMDRLGFTPAGRDIYHWTAKLPVDANGQPLFIPNMNLNEAIALLRASLLPEISAAAANLAQVVRPGFLLNLTSNETAMADVAVDHGDILLLRALLHVAEYFGYTLNAQNLDIQLSAIYAFATNQATTVERVLADYPSLFKFATTNDLAAARIAFQNAVDRYLEASVWIRTRDPNLTRLFNFDPLQANAEQNFRQTLIDLRQSLNGPVVLTTDGNYTVQLSRHFDGSTPLRDMLPAFYQNGMILGTLPSPNFGGLILGLTTPGIEEFLSSRFDMVPDFNSVQLRADGRCQLKLSALDSRPYSIEASPDMQHWTSLGNHRSTNGFLVFDDSEARTLTRRFYRAFEVPNTP